MPNVFDHLAESTFDVVTATMGKDATWNGQTARVLFNEPARDEYVNEHEYQFARPTMEYKSKDLVGLKEAADAKMMTQVDIEGILFWVKSVTGLRMSARDGHDYTAFLEQVKESDLEDEE